MSSGISSDRIINSKEHHAWTSEEIAERIKELDQRFIILPMAIYADILKGKLSAAHLQLYCYLLYVQGQNTRLWMGFEKLKKLTGYKKSRLSELLSELEKIGHITRKKRFKGATVTYCQTFMNKGMIILRGGKLSSSRMSEENKRSSQVELPNLEHNFPEEPTTDSRALTNDNMQESEEHEHTVIQTEVKYCVDIVNKYGRALSHSAGGSIDFRCYIEGECHEIECTDEEAVEYSEFLEEVGTWMTPNHQFITDPELMEYIWYIGRQYYYFHSSNMPKFHERFQKDKKLSQIGTKTSAN